MNVSLNVAISDHLRLRAMAQLLPELDADTRAEKLRAATAEQLAGLDELVRDTQALAVRLERTTLEAKAREIDEDIVAAMRAVVEERAQREAEWEQRLAPKRDELQSVRERLADVQRRIAEIEAAKA